MTSASLGTDWVAGPDGLRSRRAARVVLLDADGRVLLVRGHDADQPERSWWFTVGGGIADGETAREAAVREVREETGMAVDAGALVGPVMTRRGIFDFLRETCRQDEEFFVATVPHTELDRSGWTDGERDVLDELAWLSPDELREQPLEVFPTCLPDVVQSLSDGGWDGVVRHLGTEYDD